MLFPPVHQTSIFRRYVIFITRDIDTHRYRAVALLSIKWQWGVRLSDHCGNLLDMSSSKHRRYHQPMVVLRDSAEHCWDECCGYKAGVRTVLMRWESEVPVRQMVEVEAEGYSGKWQGETGCEGRDATLSAQVWSHLCCSSGYTWSGLSEHT